MDLKNNDKLKQAEAKAQALQAELKAKGPMEFAKANMPLVGGAAALLLIVLYLLLSGGSSSASSEKSFFQDTVKLKTCAPVTPSMTLATARSQLKLKHADYINEVREQFSSKAEAEQFEDKFNRRVQAATIAQQMSLEASSKSERKAFIEACKSLTF
ncbi:hypothetical protein K0504_17965 [Neiella marina]|uniref:Uncharacterized protein n=1 Tax=Neiella holothuriorum TaxID=2870530 RepID=A0ABS7EKT3_9GAMM|nr:hypothetical protein [Neiella holothuriorum]MBW8192925.1 hypothetical protein [Neiella holothuriorum]